MKTQSTQNTSFFELMQSASPVARRCIVGAYIKEINIRIWYVLLTLHVSVINIPFWIYAPDCDVAPPPKRPRQYSEEATASELPSFKSYHFMKGTGMSLI